LHKTLRALRYTSVKQGKFGAAMKTTNGVNSAVRRTLSACNGKHIQTVVTSNFHITLLYDI